MHTNPQYNHRASRKLNEKRENGRKGVVVQEEDIADAKNKRCNEESRGRQKKRSDDEIIVEGGHWEWNYREGGETRRGIEKQRGEKWEKKGMERGRFIGRKGRKWRTAGDGEYVETEEMKGLGDVLGNEAMEKRNLKR